MLVKCTQCPQAGLFKKGGAIHKYQHKYHDVITVSEHIQNQLKEFLSQ